MTIEKWLSDVYYDEFGTHIWNRETKDGGSQLVADIRGWGRIQNEFKTEEEAAKFQDEVGEFIVQAIREKIERAYRNNEIKKAEELGLYDKIELSNPNDSIFTSSQTEISDPIKYFHREILDPQIKKDIDVELGKQLVSSLTEISDKVEQKGILVELMEQDAKDGLYSQISEDEIRSQATRYRWTSGLISFREGAKWVLERLKRK